ncbi:MAG: hypothetical protein ACQ9MH_19285 [Nitrospinales bacterium]
MQTQDQRKTSRPFSYVDSATGFIYFNLVPSDFGVLRDQLDTALELRDKNRGQYGQKLLEIANTVMWTEFRSTFFHEWHHFLQTIIYPFQYLQSWRQLSIAFDALSGLRQSHKTFKLGHLDLLEPWRNTIKFSSMLIGLDIVNGHIEPVLNRDPNEIRPTDFTITDLIEEATSIFEFKVEINREGEGESYHQWIRKRKLSGKTTYSNVFRLLSRLIGKEGAYVALPPLVQASFSTTWPAVAFMNLVNYTIARRGDFEPEKLGCDSYYSLLRFQLTDPVFANIGSSPNPNGPTEGDEYYYLDFDSYRQIITSTPKHTVHYQALRFIDLVRNDQKLETILFHPYRLDVQNLLTKENIPPLVHLRIHHASLQARDSVLVINPTLGDMTTQLSLGLSYSEYWREVMKRKDIAYSLFTDLNNYLEHNCHHHDCLYHETNICRRWSAIPKEWTACPFPDWFVSVTDRKIDIKSKKLLKVE